MSLPEPIDELYRLPPDEFVRKRDALSDRLRSLGDQSTAEAVSNRPRPTLAAFALNQLRDREPGALTALLDLHRELRTNPRLADSSELLDRRRHLVSRLAASAAEVLAEHGHDPSSRERALAATLHAAVVDRRVASRLATGRLTTSVQPAPTNGRRATNGAVTEREARAGAEARVEAARDLVDEIQHRHDEAVNRAEKVSRQRAALELELADAERERDQTESRLRAAKQALEAAEHRLTALGGTP